MYICMYVYVYICIYVYVHVCIYVQMYCMSVLLFVFIFAYE